MATTEIETLMAATGMQVKDICAALDIPSATLNRYKRGQGTMPDDKLAKLRELAGGARPALRSLGQAKPAAVQLAQVPATTLIDELARRARAGQLKDMIPGSLDTRRSLKAVAFTDVADD